MYSGFNELKFGNIKKIDLHGLSKEDARAEIIYQLNSIDNFFSGIEFVHGYHGGHVLKDLVRKELNHPTIKEKINLSASSTLFLINKENRK